MPDLVWNCPFLGTVRWAEKDVFNPSAVVKDGKVHLIFRAEDQVGRFAGVSRIGLATSADGIAFDVHPEPVFFPEPGPHEAQEWEGGCEDPRVVEAPDGGYVMTYSAFNGISCRLYVATSPDLRIWTKHGHAFGPEMDDQWSKSGAILTELNQGRLTAKKVAGQYWMHYGEGNIFAATSSDLIRWTPVRDHLMKATHGDFSTTPATYSHEFHPPTDRVVVGPRVGGFDSLLAEPGPGGVWTPEGIHLLYNGSNRAEEGSPDHPPLAYSAGYVVLDPSDPTRVIHRDRDSFLWAERDYEVSGQLKNIIFIQGLVFHQGRWLLYHGAGDSRIGVCSPDLPLPR
jgi:predicted GH43/DUF377 family glycosyl hydrolase